MQNIKVYKLFGEHNYCCDQEQNVKSTCLNQKQVLQVVMCRAFENVQP